MNKIFDHQHDNISDNMENIKYYWKFGKFDYSKITLSLVINIIIYAHIKKN